jgi:hypothetical protein
MNTETFFKILNKQFQKEDVRNFHGIIITPIFDGEYTSFKIDNPNDLSYNKTIVGNHFYDQCDMFGKIVGIGEHTLYDSYIKLQYKDYGNRVFLNDDDTQTLVKLTSEPKKLIINSSRYDAYLESDITVEHVYLDSFGPESVGLNIEIEFKNLTNPKNPNYSLNKNINVLRNWLYDEYRNYDDITNDMFKDAHDFIIDNPLLLDDSYMYINTNISPIVYDEEGDLAEF